MKILSKYLGVQSGRTANEVAIASLILYVIPSLLLGFILDMQLINYLSFKLGFVGVIALYILICVISLVIFCFAALNVIVILDKDYKKNYSTLKKTAYFLLMSFPYVLHANFVAIYITKKSNKYKYRQLFAVSFIGIAVFFTIFSYATKDIVSIQVDKRMNKKDSAPITNVKVKTAPTTYQGLTYIIKKPFFVQLNLPRGDRFHSSSVKKAEGKLVDFVNSCSNCLDSRRLENPIKMKYLNIGSKLTVLESFSYSAQSSSNDHIILKDEDGLTVEISLSEFEYDIVSGKDDYPADLKDLFDEIEIFKALDKILCSRIDYNTPPSLQDGSTSEFANHIGSKLYQFIKDFSLIEQIEVKSFSYGQSNKLSCALIKIKSINALALLSYYGGDWGINDNFNSPENFDRLQSSEAILVNYNEYINKTKQEIFKLYP